MLDQDEHSDLVITSLLYFHETLPTDGPSDSPRIRSLFSSFTLHSPLFLTWLVRIFPEQSLLIACSPNLLRKPKDWEAPPLRPALLLG